MFGYYIVVSLKRTPSYWQAVPRMETLDKVVNPNFPSFLELVLSCPPAQTDDKVVSLDQTRYRC